MNFNEIFAKEVTPEGRKMIVSYLMMMLGKEPIEILRDASLNDILYEICQPDFMVARLLEHEMSDPILYLDSGVVYPETLAQRIQRVNTTPGMVHHFERGCVTE